MKLSETPSAESGTPLPTGNTSRAERNTECSAFPYDRLARVMFERFSAESRAVCISAGREASRFGHDAIRTEHLLVGLLSPGAGRVAAWLAIEGVYLADIRERLWGDRCGGRCSTSVPTDRP